MDLERYKTIVKEMLKNKLEFLKNIDFEKLKEKLNFKNIPLVKNKGEMDNELNKIINDKNIEKLIDKIIEDLKITDSEEMALLLNTLSSFIMENLRELCKDSLKIENYLDKICPFCGSSFKYGYIDDDGKKFLVCSVCNFGWRYPRIKCPFCETEDQKKLSYIEFENNNFVRFYECENCGKSHKVFVLENMKDFKTLDEADLDTKILDISYENKLKKKS